MAGFEVTSPVTICYKCGTAYGRAAGNFYKSYSDLYKGKQFLPYCRDCTESMYSAYFTECGDRRRAMRQLCRKLDLYWNDKAFDSIEDISTNKTVVGSYLQKINQARRIGKGYDETLREEGALWVWPTDYRDLAYARRAENDRAQQSNTGDDDVPADVIAFWGPGYTSPTYKELENRKRYYMSSFPEEAENDVGLLSLIRQICALELDINRDRAAGKDVSKSVTTHNTLLGAAGLKPIQKDDGSDAAFEKTPFGVWIERWENRRPIPEPDPDFKDVDGIVRYITVWFLGHLCKMLGIRNSYCKLYEEEIAKLRVEHPEYEEEDDENLFNDIFTSSNGGDAT